MIRALLGVTIEILEDVSNMADGEDMVPLGGGGGVKVVAITGSVVTVSAFSVKSCFYSISSIKLSVLFRGATLSDMTSGVL